MFLMNSSEAVVKMSLMNSSPKFLSQSDFSGTRVMAGCYLVMNKN